MDAGATNQFTALRNFVQEHINNGGLDIDGLTIRTNSFTSASEGLLVCQLGELVETSARRRWVGWSVGGGRQCLSSWAAFPGWTGD